MPVTLPPAADELLAWIVREATTNIVRHSSARRAEIAVTVTDAEVTLKVTDDGGSTGGSSGGTTLGITGGTTRGTKSGITRGATDVTEGDGDLRDAPGRDWLATMKDGSGLLGLQERVAAAGGRFAAGPAAGGGFRVAAVVPLTASSPPAAQSQTQAADESQTPATGGAMAS